MFLRHHDKQKTTLPTIINHKTHLKGKISCEGELQIDGKINGDVTAQSLTITKNGYVKGNVKTEYLYIYGQIIGHVDAHHVHMFPHSFIEGEITHDKITIEPDAFINGACHHRISGNEPLLANARNKTSRGAASKNAALKGAASRGAASKNATSRNAASRNVASK